MPKLDLVSIESCLIDTQKHFEQINAQLSVKRTPITDEVVTNLVAGYKKIDEFVNADIDIFAMGNSELLLELNHIVLYQSANLVEDEIEQQFEATINHFYEAKNGGVGHLIEWLNLNNGASVWKQTAGLFTYILSQPQLFLEGNHRTGSLIMSYMLMRQGYGPFVLSVSNAKHFFEPAEMIKKRRKKTFDEFLHLPKQTRKFAKLLKAEQGSQFLV